MAVQPRILPFSFGDSPIFAGQSVQVSCFVTEGDHPLNISWHFDSSHNFDTLGIITSKIGKKTSLLSIDFVTAQHTGKYICTASNHAGFSQFSAFLKINGN